MASSLIRRPRPSGLALVYRFFFAAGFFFADFFAASFFVAGFFFVADFFVVGFFAIGFFVVGFFVADFFVADFFAAGFFFVVSFFPAVIAALSSGFPGLPSQLGISSFFGEAFTCGSLAGATELAPEPPIETVLVCVPTNV